MKRVLIDLTDIESWQGHHGGTQRVVYGIAKQFFQKSDINYEVEFMAFSAREGIFYKSDFEPVFSRVEMLSKVMSAQGDQPIRITLKSRAKQLAITYVPEAIRKNKHARNAVKKTLPFVVKISQKTKKALNARRTLLNSASPKVQISFSENDIVLILGKPWDNPSMESILIKEKSSKGFLLVQVIYDLIISLYPHLHHPTLFKNYTQYVFEAIHGSDLLLPISECTEKDLGIFAKSLNLEMPKTKVIRLADEIPGSSTNGIKPDQRISDKFIACIGTVEIRKNHTLLYYAYKLAEQRGIELPQLVIVGSRGWLTGDFQYLVEHDPKVKSKIIILDNINDQGLSWVYANCLFSVYPSFYEGWGLPVAESLAKGKVCIASKVSSIPEIGGDMVDYFSPYDAESCLDLIVKYLDPELLIQKEIQLKKQYVLTSWDDTFKQVTANIDKL